MVSRSNDHPLEPSPGDDRGFVFAHLSDPHLSTLVGVPLRKLANKRLLGYMSWRTRRQGEHRREVLDELISDLTGFAPDHVVITGDMTHLGLPCEFREVGRWLQGVGPPALVTVVPGNHDMYVREDWSTTFAHWAAYMQSDGPVPGRNTGLGHSPFPSLRVRDRVAFIGVSSARPSAPLLAVGSLGHAQLRALEKILVETGRRGLFRCVMLHHPPDTGAVSWRKRLTDARRLRQIIKHCGVELLLHGHAHTSTRRSFETPGGDVPVLGVPSASALGRGSGHPARYHLHQLLRVDGGWTLRTRVRGYDGQGRGFVAAGEFVDFIQQTNSPV